MVALLFGPGGELADLVAEQANDPQIKKQIEVRITCSRRLNKSDCMIRMMP